MLHVMQLEFLVFEMLLFLLIKKHDVVLQERFDPTPDLFGLGHGLVVGQGGVVYRVAEGGVVDGQVLNGAWHEVRRTPRARKFSDTAAFEHL